MGGRKDTLSLSLSLAWSVLFFLGEKPVVLSPTLLLKKDIIYSMLNGIPAKQLEISIREQKWK